MTNNNSKLLWALSPQARIEYQKLLDAGMDPDLALALMEELVPEEAIYELDDGGDYSE